MLETPRMVTMSILLHPYPWKSRKVNLCGYIRPVSSLDYFDSLHLYSLRPKIVPQCLDDK